MNEFFFLKRVLKRLVRSLLTVSPFRFAMLFLIVAVLVSVTIVLTIDFLWDGCYNIELEFAGIITPFLDGLFLVIFISAMFSEIREEVAQRKSAETQLSKLNDELEQKVSMRTQQLSDTQDELVRKEKLAMLGQVAGSVGHELRNPLGVMSNAVYFLQTVLADTADETIIEYLGIIKDEITASEHIVSDLLDSVRTKPPHPETVSVRELIQQSLDKYTFPPSINVKLDIPPTIPQLQVDALQIRQVFYNLISNGAEAMLKGGTLTIKAIANIEANKMTISVCDTGIGMTPEQLDKLFQPLFTTKARGIGLGLMVVKNLTEANGGNIEVHSEVGKGSTFFVILPCDCSAVEIA